MNELNHTNCGGEIDIMFIYSTERYKSVEFQCRKCRQTIEYNEGGEY